MGQRLTEDQVTAFARLALEGLDREYPNKPANVMRDAGDVLSPRAMHPAFYGCFDWHSAVHGHWMLARLLKLYPNAAANAEIRARLNEHLTPENLRIEAEYFTIKENASFERMYGWAWALRLAAELDGWDDPDARRWRVAIEPLEAILVEQIHSYLPKLSYPIRTGVHPDTAFALAQTLDYARIVGNQSLEELVVARSRDYYLADRTYPSHFEPSGEDFFSPSLNEADLMRRILSADEFVRWFDEFLPTIKSGDDPLLRPVAVTDVTDGKLVHLAGLDLSRAWCLEGVAQGLPSGSLRDLLHRSAEDHLAAGLEYVFSGHYEGEHWLATFAIYAMSESGARR
jgi:hypothetical protein